jgi:hypothetical protein
MGFLEAVYQEALEIELKKAEIPYEREINQSYSLIHPCPSVVILKSELLPCLFVLLTFFRARSILYWYGFKGSGLSRGRYGGGPPVEGGHGSPSGWSEGGDFPPLLDYC